MQSTVILSKIFLFISEIFYIENWHFINFTHGATYISGDIYYYPSPNRGHMSVIYDMDYDLV
jgi:hypothetical protein